jgi:hypothetical protein
MRKHLRFFVSKHERIITSQKKYIVEIFENIKSWLMNRENQNSIFCRKIAKHVNDRSRRKRIKIRNKLVQQKHARFRQDLYKYRDSTFFFYVNIFYQSIVD